MKWLAKAYAMQRKATTSREFLRMGLRNRLAVIRFGCLLRSLRGASSSSSSSSTGGAGFGVGLSSRALGGLTGGGFGVGDAGLGGEPEAGGPG